jgi:hypothetical protein
LGVRIAGTIILFDNFFGQHNNARRIALFEVFFAIRAVSVIAIITFGVQHIAAKGKCDIYIAVYEFIVNRTGIMFIRAVIPIISPIICAIISAEIESDNITLSLQINNFHTGNPFRMF